MLSFPVASTHCHSATKALVRGFRLKVLFSMQCWHKTFHKLSCMKELAWGDIVRCNVLLRINYSSGCAMEQTLFIQSPGSILVLHCSSLKNKERVNHYSEWSDLVLEEWNHCDVFLSRQQFLAERIMFLTRSFWPSKKLFSKKNKNWHHFLVEKWVV